MFTTIRSTSLVALALAASLLPFAGSARGQCNPDWLDMGNCCQPVAANLPAFPGGFLPSLGIC